MFQDIFQHVHQYDGRFGGKSVFNNGARGVVDTIRCCLSIYAVVLTHLWDLAHYMFQY